MRREELQKILEKAQMLWPSKSDYRVCVDTNDYDGGDSLDVSISMKADEVSLPSIMELADFVGKKPEETFLNANEDNLEIHWDLDDDEGEWKPEEHYYGTLGEDMERTVRTPDDNLAIEAEHLICRAFRKAQDEEVKGLAALAMVKLREYLAQLQGNVIVVCDKQ